MEQTPRIEIDLGVLRMIAQALRADVELGLKPGASRAESEIQQGVNFGSAAPGGELAAAREVFAAVLVRARENTVRQLRSAHELTTALEQVIENYAQGDRIAAERMGDVERTLSEVAGAAEALAGGHQP